MWRNGIAIGLQSSDHREMTSVAAKCDLQACIGGCNNAITNGSRLRRSSARQREAASQDWQRHAFVQHLLLLACDLVRGAPSTSLLDLCARGPREADLCLSRSAAESLRVAFTLSSPYTCEESACKRQDEGRDGGGGHTRERQATTLAAWLPRISRLFA